MPISIPMPIIASVKIHRAGKCQMILEHYPDYMRESKMNLLKDCLVLLRQDVARIPEALVIRALDECVTSFLPYQKPPRLFIAVGNGAFNSLINNKQWMENFVPEAQLNALMDGTMGVYRTLTVVSDMYESPANRVLDDWALELVEPMKNGG